MEMTIKKVDLSITTKRNALPTSKPVAGKFHLGANLGKASFVEEENATVIFGKSNTERLLRGENYSIHWNRKKKMYIVRLQVYPTPISLRDAEWNFEDCVDFIKRRILETNYTTD